MTPARIAMTHLLPPRPAARPHHPAARRRSAVSARRPDLLDLSDAELVGLLRDPSQCADAKEALVLRYEPMVRAPDYFARRRRVMHRVLAYGVRRKRLDKNPLTKGNLPEGWTPQESPRKQLTRGQLAVPSW